MWLKYLLGVCGCPWLRVIKIFFWLNYYYFCFGPLPLLRLPGACHGLCGSSRGGRGSPDGSCGNGTSLLAVRLLLQILPAKLATEKDKLISSSHSHRKRLIYSFLRAPAACKGDSAFRPARPEPGRSHPPLGSPQPRKRYFNCTLGLNYIYIYMRFPGDFRPPNGP